jgi:asparagine synthase (glutamine-hydrolysing)
MPIALGGGGPPRLDHSRLREYLFGEEDASFESTFFEGVRRLAPAHYLICKLGTKPQIVRYWRYERRPQIDWPTRQHYIEEFLRLFNQAVECRLRANGPPGATLSGGIDSNSVVAVAAARQQQRGARLLTFSAAGPTAEGCPETHHVREASKAYPVEPFFVRHDRLEELLPGLEDQMRNIADPFDGQMVLLRAVYNEAGRQGVRVVLDGMSGDLLFAGKDAMVGMVRSGRFLQAWGHARRLRRFWGGWGPAPSISVATATWRAFVPRSIRGLLRAFREAAKSRWQGQTTSPKAALRSFAQYSDALPEPPLFHPMLVVARERYDRVAMANRIEPRDPFLDIRLVNYCLSLPPLELEGEGWPKLILRRAMQGHVPDSVRWRVGKEHLGWRFTNAFFSLHTPIDPPEEVELQGIGLTTESAELCRNQVGEAEWLQRIFWLRKWLSRVNV